MTPIIIYKSNTGFTQSYARILSEALKCPYIDLKKLSRTDLSSYDTIIFGGGVRAATISGLKSALTKLSPYEDKKIIIFAVGGNGPSDENTQVLREKNLTESNLDLPLFYMQGGFDPGKLNFALKAMLKGVAKSIKSKEAKDPSSLTREDKEFLDFFQEGHDDVDPVNTEALLDYIKGL